MPGMWELPQVWTSAKTPEITLKHAITNTEYNVSVYTTQAMPNGRGRWVKLRHVERLPLTGLTQKILRRSKLI